MMEMIPKLQLRKLDFEFFTGLAIKNGHQRKWFYTLAGGINQKSVVTTFVPYIYRYWNKQQLLHLVAFNFSYGLQFIRSKSTDFTNLTPLRYLQAFSNNHWNTVSARIEPQSWLDPHPTKILIEPQSKRDIEKIEPHLELTPTQATSTYVNLLEMGKDKEYM